MSSGSSFVPFLQLKHLENTFWRNFPGKSALEAVLLQFCNLNHFDITFKITLKSLFGEFFRKISSGSSFAPLLQLKSL